MDAWCGIDIGTQGVRAVVLDEHGRQLGTGSRSLESGAAGAGRHEQDPDTWWAALSAAVREAIGSAGDASAAQIRALAIDGTSGTVLVEDADGRPTGPALMYDDARARSQAEVAQRVGSDLWSELGYRMQPTWALPKAMWLSEQGHLPSGHRLVHQTDHLVRRLVGHVVPTDTSNALKTGVDLRSARWPTTVLSELGLQENLLPEVALPGTDVGHVSAEAAAATGLPSTCRVRLGMTDGCASQISSGALGVGEWSSTLGTTLVLKGVSADLVRDPAGAVYCHRHPDGGWLPGGASSCGAGVFRTLLPGQDLAALTEEIAAATPEKLLSAVTYPLEGTGERFPFVAPSARRFTLPEGADLDGHDTFAAACLGLAYVERLAYDVLALLGAGQPSRVALTGGAARNGWLNQLRVDVVGRPAVVPLGTGAATGMAILAASDPGDLAATAGRLVRIGAEVEPNPDRGADLAPGYERLVTALADRGWLAAEVADRVLDGAAVSG